MRRIAPPRWLVRLHPASLAKLAAQASRDPGSANACPTDRAPAWPVLPRIRLYYFFGFSCAARSSMKEMVTVVYISTGLPLAVRAGS